MRMVCVYCGSSAGSSPVYADAARDLGQALVQRGLGLVYGGARVGLMGVVADAVLDAGGEAIGVIPEGLRDKELAHTGLTELHVVPTMHERKQLMVEYADGFVALPGGTGTLDELFETFTWLQLGIHSKPVGVLDVDGYWQPLVALLERAVVAGFLRPEHAEALLVETDPDGLLDAFASWIPPHHEKWQ